MRLRALATVAASMIPVGLLAQAVEIDPALPEYAPKPGVSGTVSLGVQGDVLVLNVVLESAQQTEILIALAEAGLGFGGIAHAAAGNAAEESFEVSGGALRVMNQGRQAYSVFLLQKAQRNDRGRQISIGVSSGGQAIYQGVLRG